MIIFLDTEFTDFVDCELISIGFVSEDGQHSLYLEVQDFDRSKCNSFVQTEVWANLGRVKTAIVRKNEIGELIRRWFATLPRSVTLACDSEHDRRLLAASFDGPWPTNLTGWYDLRPLIDTSVFNNAVERYHNSERPWHHTLFDAHAHRAGWLAYMANQTHA
ncbi:3'-5' exoribonuclease [Chitinibacter sp. ZOR0017]|uniref:3'-5' exoribonuclease n=1 Tax=Chitinibacter sp. ZOR0017 TaxID=1339254 RepID=UPI0012E00679|nr:3'-5' exoribonuclease [Chitinibacter sp. ZOR0017]